jgi:preprotein translocase subunit SecD
MNPPVRFVTFMLLLSACGTANQGNNNDQIPVTSVTPPDSILVTGWYYLKDNDGLKRQLDRDTTWHFLDPVPIVTAKNIEATNIYESNFGDTGLSMQLDAPGTKAWSIATSKSVGNYLAFVLDDKLLNVAKVNSPIDVGMTALNRKIYSRKELEEFQKRIESQK